jgi:uncharacterized membrane protein
MSSTTLIIDGALLLAMIGVSFYGLASLPPGAQVPVHFGPGGYNRWVSKSTGLTMWPATGVLVYVILIVTSRDPGTHGSPATGLTIALVVILVTQIGALAVALGRNRRG